MKTVSVAITVGPKRSLSRPIAVSTADLFVEVSLSLARACSRYGSTLGHCNFCSHDLQEVMRAGACINYDSERVRLATE